MFQSFLEEAGILQSLARNFFFSNRVLFISDVKCEGEYLDKIENLNIGSEPNKAPTLSVNKYVQN